MQLTVDGVSQVFIDIAAFRSQYHLPPDFGVTCFEGKDWASVGRIGNSGQMLNRMRAAVLDAVPAHIPFERLADVLHSLGDVFRAQLESINDSIGLKQVEIDFACAGFDDVLQSAHYAWVRARIAKSLPPTFEALYQEWLDSSARLSSQVHEYQYGEAVWHVRVVNTVYGRAGIAISLDDGRTVYVHDSVLACPAEGFMVHLLKQTYEKIYNASLTS